MALSAEVGAQLGELKIIIGDPIMGAEFWAKQATQRIIQIADTAPQPLRDQAQAFKGEILLAVLLAVKKAIDERRARDAYLVEQVNLELAEIIRKD